MEKHDTNITVIPSSVRTIAAEALRALYDSEPWWPERSLADIRFVLDSQLSVGAWHGDELVGFARAVTDSRFRAYIEDVLVLAEFRSGGVGRQIILTLLDSLKDIHVVTLFCQPKLSEYYTELGFKELSRQVVMHLRNIR